MKGARKAFLILALVATAVQPCVAQTPAAPADKLERSLWMEMDEAERNLKTSPLVIRDLELNSYVRDVLCRTVGQQKCQGIRLYLVRTPAFNATMAPNGMMTVYSGLLLRTQNEAQLAAVLGHEFAHFERQHSLKLFRQIKEKSATAAWLSFTGIGLIASFGLMASIFRYSREMEQEADLGGIDMMVQAGYDTRQASAVWEQLRAEMDATAAARNTKSRKDKDGGLFASHPPTGERVAYLRARAAGTPENAGGAKTAEYRLAMAKFWPIFLDDQLKQNDFGASDYLLTSLATENWDPWLLFARGELYRRRAEDGDLARAISFYGEAIAKGGALPEAWRGRGLARIKLGERDAGIADLKAYLAQAPNATDKGMMEMVIGGAS